MAYVLVDQSVLERLSREISEIRQLILNGRPDTVEQSISHKEAAAFLGINRDTLTERIANGTYPKSIQHMNGKRRAYYRSELQGIIKTKVK
jgi:predicted DNA-binding transcriptional regulator AlpA